MVNLLPPPAAANGSGQQSSDSGHGSAFDHLLSLVATARQGVSAPAGPTAGADAVVSLGKQLAGLLKALAGHAVDLKAPDLGLTKRQLGKLQAALDALLKKHGDNGAELLASLLAASQSSLQHSAGLENLAALLGTGADGAISVQAAAQNVSLLAQAVQVLAQSADPMTLQQAIAELAGGNDAFAAQLEAAISQATALADQGLPGAPPGPAPGDGGTAAHPPPESVGQASIADSNGLDLTPAQAGNPSEGAVAEAASEDAPHAALIQALQALVQGPVAKTAPPAGTTNSAPGVAVAVASRPKTAAVAPSAPAAPRAVGEESAAEAAKLVLPAAPAIQPAPVAAEVPVEVAAASLPNVAGSGTAAKGKGQLPDNSNSEAPVRAAPGAQSTGPAPRAVSGGDSGVGGGFPRQTSQHGQGAPLKADQAAAMVVPVGSPSASVAGAPVVFSPPVAAGAAPAPLDQSVVQQIVQHATLAFQNGQQEFRLQLKPDFLGAMEVRVSIASDGGAMVRVSTDNPATKQLIDANLPQLKQAFGTTQVRVEYVPSFAQWSASTAFGQGGGAWQGQQHFSGAGHLPAALPFNGGGSAVGAGGAFAGAEAPAPAERAADGGIDLVA
ncbi:MAG: flagellar hook-length control protein FliK [Chloroflexota bacterium]